MRGVCKLLRIIVTFAVRPEFASWRRLWGFKRVNRGRVPIYFTHRGPAEVYAVITGIGARGEQTEFEELLAKPVHLCVVSGLAGSLSKQHGVGTILVAKAVKGDTSGTPITSNDSLVKIASRCGATPVEFFYTSTAVVNSSAEKLRLGQTADAVEMESFQIFNAVRQHGIPVVGVRAVSDPLDTNMPLDFNRVVGEHGEIKWFPTLFEVVRMPERFPQVLRFSLQTSRAARQLAHFLDRYLKHLIGTAGLQLSISQMWTQ
jgi:nucleoside phosphorylase